MNITESKPGCNQREAVIIEDSASCVFANDDILSVSDNDPDPDLHWWIKALTLYEDDKEVLLGDKELTDGIINAVQRLLSVQFQHISGFQNTLLGYNLNFKSVDANVSSVQILHTGKSMYMHVHMDVSIESIHGDLCPTCTICKEICTCIYILVDIKYRTCPEPSLFSSHMSPVYVHATPLNKRNQAVYTVCTVIAIIYM